ncbi:hypothetical protein AMECASPLE_003781 [Ameca splendens]|uniref:Uncharacterized protein n=1 Tax=Ameca splendens TaxID=208324 RepID=A0ABV1A740_9TELE
MWLGSHAIRLSRPKPRWKALCKQRLPHGILCLSPLTGTLDVSGPDCSSVDFQRGLRGFLRGTGLVQRQDNEHSQDGVQFRLKCWMLKVMHLLAKETPRDYGLCIKCASSAPTLSVKLMFYGKE